MRSAFVAAVLVSTAHSLPTSAPTYVGLTKNCQDATPCSGELHADTAAACEALCTAARAQPFGVCIAVDYGANNKRCYLKSKCGGTPGPCSGASSGGSCGYRSTAPPPPPPPPPPPAPPIPPAPAGSTLRGAAKKHGLYMGAAINAGNIKDIQNDPQYDTVAGAQYSLATAENRCVLLLALLLRVLVLVLLVLLGLVVLVLVLLILLLLLLLRSFSCKWGPIHPKPNGYDFIGCDTVFNYTQAHKMAFRGHNLCWHNQNPTWLKPSLSAAELTGALTGHIDTVMGHYKGKAYAWYVWIPVCEFASKSRLFIQLYIGTWSTRL